MNPHTIFETDSFAEKGSVRSSMVAPAAEKEKVGLSTYSKSRAARAPSISADNLPPNIPEENENADEDEFHFGLDQPVESGQSQAGEDASDLDVEVRRPKGMSQQKARAPAGRLD